MKIKTNLKILLFKLKYIKIYLRQDQRVDMIYLD